MNLFESKGLKAIFRFWPLPPSAILASKSFRVQETRRLCWGLFDSNYIICPICYCFIHVRIICFGFPCNVWGFVLPLERTVVACVPQKDCLSSVLCCVKLTLESVMHSYNAQLHFTGNRRRNEPDSAVGACLPAAIIGSELKAHWKRSCRG